MIKHNGQYWYWAKGEWHPVPKVDPHQRGPSRWPATYQRTTCARCKRRMPRGRIGRFCSKACFLRRNSHAT